MELLNFMLIAMSTQLLSGPSPGPKDVNPFIDAAMAQVSRICFTCQSKSTYTLVLLCLTPLLQSSGKFFGHLGGAQTAT